MVNGGIVLARRGIEPEIGKWVFPGGFVDRGEAVTAAAVRETQEEVNLKVTLLGILDAYSFPGSDIVVIVYAADVVGGALKACDECQEVRAFAPGEIPWNDLAFPSTREALRECTIGSGDCDSYGNRSAEVRSQEDTDNTEITDFHGGKNPC